jgi:acetylornithine deacetylase
MSRYQLKAGSARVKSEAATSEATPACSTAETRRSAASAESASGFSSRRWHPACAACTAPAQDVVAAEFERIGLDVSRLALLDLDDAAAGVSTQPREGRTIVVGRRTGGPRSLLINGHVDVVPPGAPELWSSDPFQPTRTNDGWLVGRGAGDMKGGFAMATLALEALLTLDPALIDGSVAFVSTLEEECTGNGSLSAARAGVVADAVVLPEPTDLGLLLAGLGIVWFEVAVHGLPTHAHLPDGAVSALDAALPLLSALRSLERYVQGCPGGESARLNVGTFRAGDSPSSVPAVAKLGVRMSFPPSWTTDEALGVVRDIIASETASNQWLREHPPAIVPNGFRAVGYEFDADVPPVAKLAAAHRDLFGCDPTLVARTSTTDARIYVNEFGIPAFCYGPRARNIHGIDEPVDLASIIDAARVLARFIVDWLSEAADG